VIEAGPANLARSSAESGLICGFELLPGGESRRIEASDALLVSAGGSGVVWLHFNASNAAARRWLANARLVSSTFLDMLEQHETRVHFATTDDSVAAAVPDLAFGDRVDPSEVVHLWAYATSRLLVTARDHAAQTADLLRQSARGELRAKSGHELLGRMLEVQADTLRQWLLHAADELDHAEDQILIGNVTRQRESLGRTRRLAMQLRRNFGPLRMALQRLNSQAAERRGGFDAEQWRALQEEVAFVIDEASGTYERAKLLQEELSSRLAEATSQNLYVLTITTIVFLPMTLLSGIFGMNVQGVPGVGEHASVNAFWWVMLVIVAAGALTWLLIRVRRLM
jgi:zinc transporter